MPSTHSFLTNDLATAAVEPMEEICIDDRARITPSEFVEQRVVALMKNSSIPLSQRHQLKCVTRR